MTAQTAQTAQTVRTPARHVTRGAVVHVSGRDYHVLRVTPHPHGVLLRTTCRTSVVLAADEHIDVTQH